MSLINEIIPEQGFEKVRDAIGAILKLELEAQKSLQSLTEDINVFIGRNQNFNQSEILMINVLCDSANYSNIHEKGSHGGTNFFIDIYCSAKQNPTDDGGYVSTKKRDKYLGMIRYILQNHKYIKLGLPAGLIMGTYVEGFENFEPTNSQDTSFIKMSRLSYSVRIVEDQKLWDGVEINAIFTTVKLDETDKGFKYESIINN